MLKRNFKLEGAVKVVDPNKGIADAIIESGRRADAQTKMLLEALKSVKPEPAQVQVVHHETKQTVHVPAPVAARRIFLVERDDQGLISRVIGNKLAFTVQRDAEGMLIKVVAETKQV